MKNESGDNFQKLREACERLVRVSSRLPGLSSLLVNQVESYTEEITATNQLFLNQIEQVSVNIQEIPIKSDLMRANQYLEKIQYNKKNLIELEDEKFGLLSRELHQYHDEVKLKIDASEAIIESSKQKYSPTVNSTLHQISERWRKSLEQLNNLANSLSVTIEMMKELIAFDKPIVEKKNRSEEAPYIQLAQAANHANNKQASIDYLKQALQIAPDDPYLLCHIGLYSVETGHIKEAEDCLRKAEAQCSDLVMVDILATRIWEAKGEDQQAIIRLVSSLPKVENIINKKELLSEIARLYLKTGEIQKAEEYWKMILQLIPCDDEAQRWTSIISPQ